MIFPRIFSSPDIHAATVILSKFIEIVSVHGKQPSAIVGDLEKEDSYCTNSIVSHLLVFFFKNSV